MVTHSSGYDRRIISKIIANLRDKYGESWLGDVLFLCWEPEGALFKQIMEFEGWKKERYHVCNEGAEADEYYVGVLDFDNWWEWTNDAQPPMSIGIVTVKKLREQGIITKPLTETQLISGNGGNECFSFRRDRLIKHCYYRQGGASHQVIPYSEHIVPFLSYDVIRLVKPDVSFRERYSEWIDRNKIRSDMLGFSKPTVSWVCQKQRAIFHLLKLAKPALKHRARKKLLHYLSPELLMIKRPKDEGPTTPQRQLSERLRKKCLQDFTNSWYYNNVIVPRFPSYDLDVPKNIWVDDWWRTYAKASICEHLVKNGVEIIV